MYAQLPPETPWSTPLEPHPPVLSNPSYLQSVIDPVSNCTITRVSDETAFSNTGAGIQHQYSKVQAWNADQSKIWLGFNWILNDSDYTVYKFLDIPMYDGRWSNVDPEIRYFFNNDVFKKVNINTEVVTTLHQFTGYGKATVGDFDGSLSEDDRYIVVLSENLQNASLYDIISDNVVSTFNHPAGIGNASITPWGDYISMSINNRIELYDLNFNFIRVIFDRGAHGDFRKDVNGNEVFIGMCPLEMSKLSDGIQIDLMPQTTYTQGTCGDATNNPYICGHASGKNKDLDGWVLISAGIDDCNNGYPGYYHRSELFLLKLDGSGTIKSFGFSRSTYGTYLAEAKATVRPDGQKVLFTSDWDVNGNTDGTVDYIVEYNSIPLPINLIRFEGESQHKFIDLFWALNAPNIQNNFYIERSLDGIHWQEIGTTNKNTMEGGIAHYQFRDENPNLGTNYYRLKQIYSDLSFDYSQVIEVEYSLTKVTMHPNPTKGLVFFNNLKMNEKYRLLDMYGRLVKEDYLEGNSIDLSNLNSGLYFIHLGGEESLFTFKILKK